MARIGLVSDSHGRGLEGLVDRIRGLEVDRIIFLGDFYKDGLYLARETGLACLNILGNNDSQLLGQVPSEELVKIGGYQIFACHGHLYGVKSGLDRLSYRVEELGADICLYGHSHIYRVDKINDIYYINPGSPSLPRGLGSKATFIVLDLSQGIKVEKIYM